MLRGRRALFIIIVVVVLVLGFGAVLEGEAKDEYEDERCPTGWRCAVRRLLLPEDAGLGQELDDVPWLEGIINA